jgi:GntR family transcriptional regulator
VASEEVEASGAFLRLLENMNSDDRCIRTVQFVIDAKSSVPFYRQIIDQVKAAVACGHIRPRDQLPTVHQVATDLCINRTNVIRAYRTLELEGMLATKHGSETFVSDHWLAIDQHERQRMLDQILADMLDRASSYGFTHEDVLDGLCRRRKTT